MLFFTAFASTYLSLDEVALCDLVTNIRDPSGAFCPYLRLTPTKSNSFCRPFQRIDGSNRDRGSLGFSAKLTSLLKFGANSDRMDDGSITTAQAYTYGLKNHELNIQHRLQNKEVMDWVLSHRQKKDIYLIVGYHTVKDAQVNSRHDSQEGMETEAHIPVSKAILPGSSSIPFSQATDVALSAKASHQHKQTTSFLAPGERIIGIKYRKLKFARVKSGAVQSGSSSSNSAPHKAYPLEITLTDKDKWIDFSTRRPSHIESPISKIPGKDEGDEGDKGIKIAWCFDDLSEQDLHDIMEVDYELDSNQYEIGVFLEMTGEQEATPQEDITGKGSKLVDDDQGDEASLWVFIDEDT